MTYARILVVEDEAPIRAMLSFTLGRHGFQISEAADVAQARALMREALPDLLLVDWMLPDESGIDFVKRLKREESTRGLPIIMLTARADEDDRVKGLECGADDYVIKPFSPKELVARINAVLRRMRPERSRQPVELGGLCLEPETHRVRAGEQALEVGPTEFRILHFFMTHPERVYSRGQLLDMVWGTNVYIEERTVDVHIRRLRKALEPHGFDKLVQTVRGTGYRFSARD